MPCVARRVLLPVDSLRLTNTYGMLCSAVTNPPLLQTEPAPDFGFPLRRSSRRRRVSGR